MTAIVRASGIRGYQALMRGLGVDPLPLLARFHIPPDALDDAEALISLRAVINLMEASAHATGCQDLGLRLAESQDIGILGPLAVAMQHSRTVADALQLASRHMFVQSPALFLTIMPDSELVPGCVELRFDIQLAGQPVQRQTMDQCLGDLHMIARFLAGEAYGLRAVSLPHTPRAPLAAYVRSFGAPVYPAQEHGGLHIERAILSRPLAGVNESLRQIALGYLVDNFSDPSQSVTARVRLALRQMLGGAAGDKVAIADLLGLHPRTLQRRLAAEGTSFDRVRDSVRRQLALRYLCETQIPLAQLAGLLGLSEQAALTRACRRWFGVTPSCLRREGEAALS